MVLIVYTIGIWLAKSSTLLLFYEVFQVSKAMRLAIWFGLAFNFALFGTNIVMRSYYFAPHMGRTWIDLVIEHPARVESNLDGAIVPWGVASSVASTVLDLYIFVLPLPLICKLNLPPRKRVRLAFIFLTAFL